MAISKKVERECLYGSVSITINQICFLRTSSFYITPLILINKNSVGEVNQQKNELLIQWESIRVKVIEDG